MLKLMLLFLMLLLCSLAFSQMPEWDWAVRGGGTEYDCGFCTAVDDQGNVFVAGEFWGTVSYGATTFTTRGNLDIIVGKLNANHEWVWARQAGGIGADHVLGIATDHLGNVYVTGSFTETATFATTDLTSYGGRDIYVAKLNSGGFLQWVYQAGGVSNDEGNALAVTDSNNVYITGYYEGNASFGTQAITGFGGSDVFVAKMNSNGDFLWARGAGGTNGDVGSAIAVDDTGHSYITGYFTNAALFGTTNLISNGENDMFIAKLDTNGGLLGAFHAGGTSSDNGTGIALDDQGNIYIVGNFWTSITFGPYLLTCHEAVDIFVVKMNSSAVYMWARSAGGEDYDAGLAITADHAGNTYITGNFQGTATFATTEVTSWGDSDAYVAKLDTNGYLKWVIQFGGDTSDAGWDICTDYQGGLYVTGFFYGTASFGSSVLTSMGICDTFLGKLIDTQVANDDNTAGINPSASVLYPVYPNPIHAGQTATIKANIAANENGTLSIYNLRGQRVVNYDLSPGQQQIRYDFHGLASGIYFYRLKTQTVDCVNKVVLCK
jgi:hypothetical protein